MKVQQDDLPYRPITITLTTKSEAQAFFSIIDKVNEHLHMSVPEEKIAGELSDINTNMEVNF